MSQRAIPVAALDARLAEIVAELERLAVERDLLQSLRKTAVPFNAIAANGGNGVSERPLGITSAIRRLLALHPGTLRAEIPDLLRDSIRTNSTDVVRTIQTTIYNMDRRGAIRIDDAGRCFARDKEEVEL